MKFLDHPPRYLFFTGKGGVGKTSIASATALTLAKAGKRVLLVSTDPASNVAQVFEQQIGNAITPIAKVPNLWALEINPQAAAAAYRAKIVDPVRGILPKDVVQGIEEQLSGACTTEIAAFDEFTALLTKSELTAPYEHIIFDTAPTGHTIRLLQLPGAWSGFLESSKSGTSCLGPLAGLEKQRAQYREALDALRDATRTRLILVARAQHGALKEVARTHEELASIGLCNQYLVVNGCYPESAVEGDPLASAIRKREIAALNALPSTLGELPTEMIPLKSFNLVGCAALEALFDETPSGVCSPEAESNADCASELKTQFGEQSLDALLTKLAARGHGLVMLMGKGGVGKTTMAASIALGLAQRGFPVHLSTSDPAAHLAETLTGVHPHLTVSRIDPALETEHYRQQVLDAQGKDLDEAGRALLEEDLRSPCTEEIAVFQAFSRIIREAGEKFVVMDTAPTGHTLLLLDATGAYHREVLRHSREATPVLTPLMQLQNPAETSVLIVTLAETTPVLEAMQLEQDLKRAGIQPAAWIINQSVAAAQTHAPLLCERARHEAEVIEKLVATRPADKLAIVPLLAEEPRGAERLTALLRL